MCGDKYEPAVSFEKYFTILLNEKIDSLKSVMSEREKAAINAAQALITKDGQEQMAKFVLKEELNDRIREIDNKIVGPLGLELRMRACEQSKGVVDAKMYMIIIGLSALITACMGAGLHILLK